VAGHFPGPPGKAAYPLLTKIDLETLSCSSTFKITVDDPLTHGHLQCYN
jgi:hypothetical protein